MEGDAKYCATKRLWGMDVNDERKAWRFGLIVPRHMGDVGFRFLVTAHSLIIPKWGTKKSVELI